MKTLIVSFVSEPAQIFKKSTFTKKVQCTTLWRAHAPFFKSFPVKNLINHIKSLYFTERHYGLIYIHHFFSYIAAAVMYIFTGAYFLELGMPLHFILLFYGLEFGVRGMLCPFGLMFLNKVGLIKAVSVSSLLFILFFVGLSFADNNLFLGFFSLFFAALAGAIYYPFMDVLEALYIEEDHNRTKQLSMGLIVKSLGRAVGAASVGFLMTYYGFDRVILFAGVSLIFALLPFFWLHKITPYIPEIKAAEVYKFLVRDDFKPLLTPFFGQQLIIIVNSVMIPIFIYSIVGEMNVLGYLVALALIGEKIGTLFAGHYTDKTSVSKTIQVSMFTYSLAMLAYIFLAKTTLSVFFVETYNKITHNAYNSAFRSGIHAHARRTHGNHIMLFGAGWQMALCFGELLVLPLYALLAYFIGSNVFYVAFCMAIVGLWFIHRHFKN